MMNFYQFWDKLNGKPYEDGVPQPVQYNLEDYGSSSNSYELKPLQPEDMSQASAEDVAAEYLRIHKGKNPCGLGKQMSDDDLKKFYGQTW